MKNKKTITTVSVTLLLLAAVYFLLNSESILSDRIKYTGFYGNVRGLQATSPIYYKGVKVGAVDGIDLNIGEKVRVTLAIDKNLRLTKDTRAVITSDEVSGSKAISLEPGSSPEIVLPGGIVLTAVDSSMIESFHAKISPVLYNGKSLLNYSDSALQSINNLIVNGLSKEIRLDLQSFNRTMNDLRSSSAQTSSKTLEFQKTIGRLDSATTRPSQTNEKINTRLSDAASSSAKAAGTPIGKNLEKLGNSLNKLSASLDKAGKNKLIISGETYKSASRSADSLDRSLKDLKENPPSFINILSPGK